MSDYDFRQLNDKEFEVFCADLLGVVHGHRIERFKPGRDSGVDGRFFSSSGKEVILQCKHWSSTPLGNLIRTLKKAEKPKLEKLNPEKYIFAVSNPLSRSDKEEIFKIFAPYISSESDIYGKEDLNDLLSKHPAVERRHYKLWLHSASVIANVFSSALIGRSEHSLKEIVSTSRMYAITYNHERALTILEKLGVLIISGEPGVGKTTLANHLCLKYVAEGYEYYKVSDDIKEVESVFNANAKQIFYFDDFLGRNYLDALRGHEGSQVTQFIRRISANKKMRFVLTSRSTILNQGKLLFDSFEHDNLKRNEFELRIKSLSEIDKAKILYNHIYHSGIGDDYVEQLYVDKRYRAVISHRNFNPRLISYITDPARLENCPADAYWQYVVASLDDPSQIWDNPFSVQLDDFGRALVLFVVLHGYAIHESQLAEAYQCFVSLPSSQSLQGRRDYLTSLRVLTGSFLNRTVSSVGLQTIDLFNPSIGDYVLRRYSRDVASIQTALMCLKTTMSLYTLISLRRWEYVSYAQYKQICRALLKNAHVSGYEGLRCSYISKLIRIYIELFGEGARDESEIQAAVLHLIAARHGEISEDSFVAMKWAVEVELIAPLDAAKFVSAHYQFASSDEEIRSISELIEKFPKGFEEYTAVGDVVRSHVFSLISENFLEFVEANDAFSKVQYGDYDSAKQELEHLLAGKLDELGISYDQTNISEIVGCYDIAYELDRYFENTFDTGDRSVEGPIGLIIDEIDDLFEKS
ncbi:Restriction endonuclease [Halopseudomonas xinjiangensis]|uniref:Restriction endonuclease n=1 Tax=Halopseudomonas xinjiangensis TaxID=487184 RepID=A0A1H1P530_9GAMM|nr:restriction endonuclease [Halopseudomonas xinjiangensis]SDS06297.1 Restriction endonuclease [Halopseudomonas xinjiangensis]